MNIDVAPLGHSKPSRTKGHFVLINGQVFRKVLWTSAFGVQIIKGDDVPFFEESITHSKNLKEEGIVEYI